MKELELERNKNTELATENKQQQNENAQLRRELAAMTDKVCYFTIKIKCF